MFHPHSSKLVIVHSIHVVHDIGPLIKTDDFIVYDVSLGRPYDTQRFCGT